MQDHLIELCVGETLLVGQYRVTLLQVEGNELSIEVVGDDGSGWGEFANSNHTDAVAVC